jgi:hypothetical protein
VALQLEPHLQLTVIIIVSHPFPAQLCGDAKEVRKQTEERRQKAPRGQLLCTDTGTFGQVCFSQKPRV